MKIKVREITKGCKFEFIKKGEWVDLKSAESVDLAAPKVSKYKMVVFDTKLIPLGIAMELPKYFEAHINSRSSTFNKFKVLLTNSTGIIDSSYCGNNDEWKYNAMAFADTHIDKGDRICQFRIQPSQKAPWWVKLKWLFTNKIEFVWVDKLEGPNRGGFGSTGVK